MNVSLSFNQKSDKDKVTLHRLPCNVKYSGPARVSDYFEPNILTGSKDNKRTASFRGRPLHGNQVEVPPKYKASLLTKQESGDDLKFRRGQDCDKVIVWELDREPKQSPFNKGLQWIQIASAIHGDL